MRHFSIAGVVLALVVAGGCGESDEQIAAEKAAEETREAAEALRGNDGELNLVVGKRFLVTIEGNNISDTTVLQEFASKIDAGKLAAMK